jgi:hypothetical protein
MYKCNNELDKDLIIGLTDIVTDKIFNDKYYMGSYYLASSI